ERSGCVRTGRLRRSLRPLASLHRADPPRCARAWGDAGGFAHRGGLSRDAGRVEDPGLSDGHPRTRAGGRLMPVVAAPHDMESEYNVRLLHPNRAQFHERFASRSRAAYRELAPVRNVRYAAGERAVMDLFPPANGARGEGTPVV